MNTRLLSIRSISMLSLMALSVASLTGCAVLGGNDAEGYEYQVGKGRRDITGPLSQVQMFGFVREGQTTAGVHLRLWSRAFVIAEADNPRSRLAFVTADLGSMPHEIQRDVVDRLQAKYGKLYRLDNVILTATHTHAGPGGYWHYGSDTPLGSPLYLEHYNALVEGITQSIVDAHESMEPANIFIGRGEVEGGGANRSVTAYMNNPDEEIARYEHNTDREMTQLKFVGREGAIGVLNWFAVHPTAMTYNNRLISGDHKGYAAQEFESHFERRSEADYENPAFVAAFANANCGDVTPNLNLNNTGPGENEFETTRIIGSRQLDVAWQLFRTASEPVSGPISSVQDYVDFSSLQIDAAWTNGAGPQHTCPSAYGYAFAAGSTEDGGGHPLFREGMLKRNAMIDTIAAEMVGRRPSDAIRECQLPKVVLFAPGEMDPPGQAQVLPLGIARIGPLVLVAHPGEITTMSGRRVRDTVAAALGTTPEWVVIAAYSNDFTGYTTTYEEYQTQQYEGGHTLYGPWQLAGYQQEYDRLSRLLSGELEPSKEPGPQPRDLRGKIESTPLGTELDPLLPGEAFGSVLEEAQRVYERGTQVSVAFRTGNPQNDFRNGGNTISIEREHEGKWAPALTDRDWSTKFHWSEDAVPPPAPPLTVEDLVSSGAKEENSEGQPPATDETPAGESERTGESEGTEEAKAGPMASRATVTWDIPLDMEPGTYRIVFHGAFRNPRTGEVEHFSASSNRFTVR